MRNIFHEIKERVDLRDLVSYYGLDVDRGGFACCPFHNERTPSFKVYEDHYHCFGCGEHGDHVDFVQKLYGISNIEAARKISHDFGLELKPKNISVSEKSTQKKNDDFELWRNNSVSTLTGYIKLLEKWSMIYVPRSPIDEVDERYLESIHNKAYAENYLETLMFGTKDEINDLYENERDYPGKIKNRLDSLDAVNLDVYKRVI